MLPLSYRVSAHANCLCNEFVSLTNRHWAGAYEWTKTQKKYFKNHSFDLPIVQGYEKVSKKHVIDGYVGAKKNSYIRAYMRLKEGVDIRRITKVKMFVKVDKFPYEMLAGTTPKAPRAIQFRSQEYNLLMAAYLKPYEEGLYSQLTSGIGMRAVAKGLNNVERASNIVAAMHQFQQPVFIMADHAKFDSSVSVEHLKWVTRQYYRTTRSKWLRYLSSKNINNVGTSTNGIRYKVRGTRMSGDYDTALGNTMINYVVLTSWLRNIKHHMLIDGDDSVIIVERKEIGPTVLDELREHCHNMGFNTELSMTMVPEEVEFCQSKLIPTNPPRFGRNPRRAMSNYNTTITDYDGDARLRYLAGVGQGELAASAGVPIMQAFAVAMARAHARPMYIEELAKAYGPAALPMNISNEVREYYSMQWGVTPYEQLMIESSFSTPGRVTYEQLSDFYDNLSYEFY